MFDYETLKLIWWLLIGVLLIGFAVADGFDMGVLSLLRVVGKTDSERRVMLNTVGPHWDGNQVWLITAAGAIFAAWPVVYAVAFSGLYWAMLLVLFALFFRPVGFEYRSKITTPRWRNNWDWLLTAASAIPALVFGVAFGNLLLGLPFHLDSDMRSYYSGSFWQLLSPFALLCGLVSLSMLAMHGAAYLQLRTSGAVLQRSQRVVMLAAAVTLGLFLLAGVWVSTLDGYVMAAGADTGGAMTPLAKTVTLEAGGWLRNYREYPLSMVVPVVAGVALLAVALLSRWRRAGLAFFSSAVAVAAIILTAGCSLFPFLLPSRTEPSLSLTVWDAVSSHKTLGVMFWVAMVFVPIVLSYTLWGYWKMRGRLSVDFIEANPYSTY